ncbi:hypothetical protein GCM10010435_41240 [Winogradskya consettensis]|uniref:Uncharacterized protein n=2 Tax=Winogradskya consettensis TaxID=113560 RepID=A0A919SSQ9_9ACTN|nr:hypothetical protein Aco04nite_52640 [Actinoplanes consettensis]
MIKPRECHLNDDMLSCCEMMRPMDRVESRCHLDWWANSVTLLASVEIAVVIAAADTGWAAEGCLISDDQEERDGFAFLCDMDPVFILRFDDESTITVTVHPPADNRRFVLTEYTGPAHRPINHRVTI